MTARSQIAAVLFVVLSTSAQAQGAPAFYPLGDGDTWTYERMDRDGNSESRFTGYRRVTVLSDTTIEGDAYKTARVEFLRFSQAIDSTSRCAVRLVGADAVVEWRSVRGACGASESGLPLGSVVPATQLYFIGGLPYEGPTRTASASYPYPYALTAEGVGAVMTRIWPGGVSEQQNLLAATVGGTPYGEMPGPTAWRAFQPLFVGDRWAYQRVLSRLSPYQTSYRTYTVAGTQAVDGVPYFRVVVTNYDAAFAVVAAQTQLWRHRDDLGCVVIRGGSGVETCRYEGYDEGLASVRVQSLMRDGTVDIGGQTVVARVIRDSCGAGGGGPGGAIAIAAGIGSVSTSRNSGGSGGGFNSEDQLMYARIGGVKFVEYGAAPSWAVWNAPTGGEDGADTPEAFAARLAGPNPTRSAVSLHVRIPYASSVRLDVYDVLGRRVTGGVEDVPAGDQTVAVDLTGQAPGAYLVRVTGPGGARASVPVTVY